MYHIGFAVAFAIIAAAHLRQAFYREEREHSKEVGFVFGVVPFACLVVSVAMVIANIVAFFA